MKVETATLGETILYILRKFSFVKKFDRLLFSWEFILCHTFCIHFSKNISSVFDLFGW